MCNQNDDEFFEAIYEVAYDALESDPTPTIYYCYKQALACMIVKTLDETVKSTEFSEKWNIKRKQMFDELGLVENQ